MDAYDLVREIDRTIYERTTDRVFTQWESAFESLNEYGTELAWRIEKEFVAMHDKLRIANARLREVAEVCASDWINLANSSDPFLAKQYKLVVRTEDVLDALLGDVGEERP